MLRKICLSAIENTARPEAHDMYIWVMMCTYTVFLPHSVIKKFKTLSGWKFRFFMLRSGI